MAIKRGGSVDREARRGLPPVGAVLGHSVLEESVRARGRAAVLRAVRAAIEEARGGLRGGKGRPGSGRTGGAIVADSPTRAGERAAGDQRDGRAAAYRARAGAAGV